MDPRHPHPPDRLEPDAGTPQLPDGGKGDQHKSNKPFPWEKQDSPAMSGDQQPQRPAANPASSSNYLDNQDPNPDNHFHALTQLTMLMAHPATPKKCVPLDLRKVIKDNVGPATVKMTEDRLRRLKDLGVVSLGSEFSDFFYAESASESRRDDNERQGDFLEYLFRRGMLAVLKYLKFLNEEGKHEIVKVVLDFIKDRRYFNEEPNPNPERVGWIPESCTQFKEPLEVKKGKYHGTQSRVYKMSAAPRGYVLIINNEDFRKSGGQYKARLGTHVDGQKLASLFKQLGFEMYGSRQHWDKTKQEMSVLIDEFASFHKHQWADAAIVCILSHGQDNGWIAGVDGDNLNERQIRERFSSSNCRHLADKPKIFLFVACRGNNSDNGYEVSSPDSAEIDDQKAVVQLHYQSSSVVVADTLSPPRVRDSGDSRAFRPVKPIAKIPDMTDSVVIYATVPGFQSLRSTRNGTWFVQDLTAVFAEEACLNDLNTMVTEVNNRMGTRMSDDGEKQSLQFVSDMRKLVFFNPGWSDKSE